MLRAIIFALCLIGGAASAATRIASVSGNWADTATWGGAAAPVTGDWAQINGDIIVTIPTGTSAACARVYIGLTNNTTGTATLAINGTLTLDASGQLRIGDQTTGSRDGILTFGPGGVLAGAGSIYFNQGKLLSTATKADPAKITGSIAVTTLATGPKQYVDIANISFQNTGTIALVLQNTLGAFASQFIATNCVFSGNAAITIGSTTTPNTAPISITNCDIREGTGGKSITLRRITGGAAAFTFSNNTVYQTAGPYYIYGLTSTGLTVSGNVLFNCYVQNDSAAGGMIITNNLFASDINTPSILILTDAAAGNTITYNYFLGLTAGNNLRGLIPPSSSGGSGTNTVQYNVLEGPSDATHDKPDLIVARGDSIPLDIRYNLIIYAGEVVVGGRVGAWSLGITNKNNTIAGTVPAADSSVGNIYTPEGLPNGGTMLIANNLVLGNAKLGANTIGAPSSGTQTIASSDYNNFYNFAVPYDQTAALVITAGNTTKTVPAAHDTAANPQFFDLTRDAAKWGLYFAGTETEAAAISLLMTFNGYRGTPNFDQNGTQTAYSARTMLDWIRYGYSPTNLTLRAAGDPADGSPDIGAIPVRAPAHGAFF